jgi:hypothetical protein
MIHDLSKVVDEVDSGHGSCVQQALRGRGQGHRPKGSVSRWRRALPPGERRRGEVMDLSLHARRAVPRDGFGGPSMRSRWPRHANVPPSAAGCVSTGSTRSRCGGRKKLDATKSMTFDACAAAYIDAHKAGWRNAKHIDQWSSTLATYASRSSAPYRCRPSMSGS